MLKQVNTNCYQYFALPSKISRRDEDIIVYPILNPSPAIKANSYYFGHPEWGLNYFQACHRDENFIELWRAVIGSWQDKIVVDIGCGAGNIYASLQPYCGQPQLLLGVDVSLGALRMASKIGYTAVLADAHNLPFVSGFADIVMLNASLHHCDDMARVLQEAAKLLRPGGLLITDHDPQKSAYQFKGIGSLLWELRLPIYKLLKRGGHSTTEEQAWCLATEVHHKACDGVTSEMFHQLLDPMGFKVNIYPHNHTVGAAALKGNYGKPFWKYRLAQRLSGINPSLREAALTLMCVATRMD
ncbi:class I SAM-dependent methyltransferase [Nodularia harveyana UHCC-0300]|uniref:Class I SAM-dependent methyltransferase n=1 Tax=Nodularia harveyana UHCC-0300 TaxID=2974287 RepID=A0ABU5UH80_9CYAN|nr:class I SAM-dependent methyltransferase [Nodularia harveyana]MEA5582923.1 class I SAM-dependent methyltransferase [Nodularia harveyana UHCC-0300]